MKNQKAFTFVEIMIVIVIITLLAAMMIPAFMRVKFTSIEKAIIAGTPVSKEQREFYKEHRSWSQRKNVESASTDTEDLPSVSLQKLNIEGKTYILVPKTEARETEIAGKIYWLVPASR